MKRQTSGVRHDYKDTFVASSSRGRWALFAFGVSLPIIGSVLLLLGTPRQPLAVRPTETLLEPPAPSAAIAPLPAGPIDLGSDVNLDAAPAEAVEPPGIILDLLVKRGDTLEVLFRRNGLSLTDLAAMVALPDASAALKLLKPGDRLEISHRDGQVLSLRRELDDIKLLSIARQESGFAANTIERAVDIRTTAAHGEIRSSLFEAGADAGISDHTTMDMAGIFEWDIDFIQDPREGDTFTVIYEELWRDGVKLRDGEIVAAEFVNQGKSFRAARFRDESGRAGYFTPEGRSVRKAFIRAPLNFSRISSNFNPSRRHPVLNTIRAHRGVDYAAPTGTPVRAAGDGKVLFRGVQGGYGNTIILQHGGNITTLYGHLSRFGNARTGGRVNQGDVIGYVGSSGLATGPHLHYEYRVNGAHRNPRTVSLPPADPIPAEQQLAFETATEPLWRQLDGYLRSAGTTVQAEEPAADVEPGSAPVSPN
ncbi:MAG TPA: M23 family metallopeptidase [Gammaproteobacteria bacterium]|nr:M23 family metallopeptidase [Gammaproteobacteria bacterium]